MSNLARRVEALEGQTHGLWDPFALLNDDELDTFVTILGEYHDGDREAALVLWDQCSDAERAKFLRVVQLHTSEGLH